MEGSRHNQVILLRMSQDIEALSYLYSCRQKRFSSSKIIYAIQNKNLLFIQDSLSKPRPLNTHCSPWHGQSCRCSTPALVASAFLSPSLLKLLLLLVYCHWFQLRLQLYLCVMISERSSDLGLSGGKRQFLPLQHLVHWLRVSSSGFCLANREPRQKLVGGVTVLSCN